MNIKPLEDRVLIEPASKEELTKSGIVLPDTTDKEKPEQGKVIAIGAGRIDNNGKRILMTVKVGDVVLFTKYGPNEVKIDDKEYLIAKEEDILAIIN
ncbi:co-chaperone GroES [Patescibacteria group bacterium]|nr:co-chaperone GroES [Patescibacteria group bacterium]MBU4458571.1 co-chaperone GroES [Patescibacteria group bacterium]MCG2696099.1 co-chaperone GroES [Candidatus Portnoybacteria bacterium]